VSVVAKKICVQARNRLKHFDKLKPKSGPKPSLTREIRSDLQLWDTIKIQIELFNVPSKVGNCAVPPEDLHSEISWALATFQKDKLFELRGCFVCIWIRFYTYSNKSKSLQFI